VSNVVQFPFSPAGAQRPASFQVGASLLDAPPPDTHVVQFYDEEDFLYDTVGRYLRSGLRAGGTAVIIATPAHAEGIAARLEDQSTLAREQGRLQIVDAEALLGQFMIGGHPDEALFLGALERLLVGVAPTQSAAGGLRAFGEMVDVLWRRGSSAAALELDALWNRARRRFELSLFCAYTMRNFYKQDDSGQFRDLCELHTHVIPTESVDWHTGNAFDCLRKISLLEQRARLLESEVQYRKEVEGALTESMLVRGRIEAELRSAADREHTRFLSASCRELFTRILDPLQQVLTTARHMAARPDAAEEPGWQELTARGAELRALIEQVLLVERQPTGGAGPSEPPPARGRETPGERQPR
jgi:hypothetical protein